MTLNNSSLQKGLVLHLPLDKESLQSPVVLADKTPYENVGTSANAVSFVPDRMGQANRAMSFNGIDDRVNCGNDPSLSFSAGDPWTFSVWAYPPSVTWQPLMGRQNISPYILLHIGNTLAYRDTSQVYRYFSINTESNKWQNIVLMSDGTRLLSYKNGIPYNELIPSDTAITFQYIANGAGNRFFRGSIADVRIHNRALSPEEVTALYEQYRPKVKIVAGKPKLLV